MKKLVLSLLVPVLLSAGCARHYYRIEGGTLEISLKAPNASSVLFASSLDDYTPVPAVKTDEKTWVVSVPAEREFSYFYIIDGSVFVPDCACRENDDFGSENCIYLPEM